MMESKKVFWMSLVVVLVAAFLFGGAPAAMAEEPAPVHIVFVSSRARLSLGDCALLEWHVEGGFMVALNGQPVSHMGHKQVCPKRSMVFALEVDLGDRMERRELAIVVEGAEPSPPQPNPPAPNPAPQGVTISFRADRTSLNAGECTALRWDVEHAKEVYLDGQGVVGHSAKQVCPKAGRTFVLHVVHAGGNTEQRVTIQVNGGSAPPNPSPNPNPNPNPGQPKADLAVTDLYPAKLPQGAIWVRVTNHGPASLNNAQIELKCNAYGKPLTGSTPWSHVEAPWQRTVSLSPGQTVALKTNVSVDTTKYQWTVTCSAGPPSMAWTFNDPNNSNNVYSESFAGQAQPPKQVPFRANVAVTDLFAKNVKGGRLFARITNHGPGTLKNAQVNLVCQGAGFQGTQPTVIKGGGTRVLNLSPGQTAIVETGITINTNQYHYYEMSCSVKAPFAGNNSYSELIK